MSGSAPALSCRAEVKSSTPIKAEAASAILSAFLEKARAVFCCWCSSRSDAPRQHPEVVASNQEVAQQLSVVAQALGSS
jgi:hypothetical protein